jgi:hypothetical protein
VFISVGGTTLAFENVMDPATVQADINRRRAMRITQKNENAGKDDRERFATWIAAYHQNMNEFNKPINAAQPPTATTNPFAEPPKKQKNMDDMPIGEDDDFGDEAGFGGNMSEEVAGKYDGYC